MPGNQWPESWLTQNSLKNISSLAQALGTEADTLTSIIEYGQQAGKHNEFHDMSTNLGIQEKTCLDIFCNFICIQNKQEFDQIIKKISSLIN